MAAKKLVAARDAFAAALVEVDTFINGTQEARLKKSPETLGCRHGGEG